MFTFENAFLFPTFLSTPAPRLAASLALYGSLLGLLRVVSAEDFRWAKGRIVLQEKGPAEAGPSYM